MGSRVSRPQGHSATGGINKTKNVSDHNRNQTRKLPASSAVRYVYVGCSKSTQTGAATRTIVYLLQWWNNHHRSNKILL